SAVERTTPVKVTIAPPPSLTSANAFSSSPGSKGESWIRTPILAAGHGREEGYRLGAGDGAIVRDDLCVDGGLDDLGALHREICGLVVAAEPFDQVADRHHICGGSDFFLAAVEPLAEPGEIKNLHSSGTGGLSKCAQTERRYCQPVQTVR